MIQPPLSLYVHLPWCVRKCPYCDFNSHPVRGAVDQSGYVRALLQDLARDLERVPGRRLESLFIGGGTPSLFGGDAIAALLEGIGALAELAPGAEVTLEANPGTADAANFRAYREAGVNRLSIGVQSFSDQALERLGRIHDAAEARAAFEAARQAGFDNINLDLMFGLPGQGVEGALADLEQALALVPDHLSWYQLTLEPNTPFHHHPPPLPGEETLWRIQEEGAALLASAGYCRYEVSAWSLPGRQCHHNLNYWRFGDYLGIGAGAHGKVSGETVLRYWKTRHPNRYLEQVATGAVAGERRVEGESLVLEFMMNAMRLVEGVKMGCFERHTGLPSTALQSGLGRARELGLMELDRLQPTPKGMELLNDLLLCFHP